jgi:hypothetical protein
MPARFALAATPRACRAEPGAMPDPGLGPDSGLGGFGGDFDFPQFPTAK